MLKMNGMGERMWSKEKERKSDGRGGVKEVGRVQRSQRNEIR